MINKLVLRGGKPLKGKIEIRGSKNAASKMMIASLLTSEPCILENVPLSEEIDITKELCERIGSRVSLEQNHRCLIETPEIKNSLVSQLSRRNRIPILAIGPLLHRKGFAEIPVLAGCPIGHRPINFHIEALNRMGVRIERRENSYYAEAEEITGAAISLPYPSVGATENIILTAVRARGKTTIQNAAVEPEIINLIQMLQAMGARIRINSPSRSIEIEGVTELHGVTAHVIPDRNEIISFAAATLATHGNIAIQLPPNPHYRSVQLVADLTIFLEKVKEIGAAIQVEDQTIKFLSNSTYHSATIKTAPHPGFMTDWQQPFCVILTQAQGISTIHETVYEDRFGYIKDLNRMGAKIETLDECPNHETCRFQDQTFNHVARISGPTHLIGTDISIPDIRAGMAHIIAALVAEGESHISGIEHIDRGYEKLDERLRALGADIQRIQAPNSKLQTPNNIK